MPRTLSLNARETLDAADPADLEICLMQFEHPDLDTPLRLSTDNTARISDDPLVYGTRSSWRGADPETEPFTFIPIALELPGDSADAPQSVAFVIDVFDARLPALLRGFRTRATAHIAIVMASTPSVIEQEFLDLQVIGSQIGQSVRIEASRQPIEDEGTPMDPIGPSRFPGLFR